MFIKVTQILVSRGNQFFKDVKYLKGDTLSAYKKGLNSETEKENKVKESKRKETNIVLEKQFKAKCW